MTARVLVVGGGPAGLSAAAALRRAGAGSVVVTDREPAPGGATRHTGHTGFGLRDLRRVLSGPAYAARLADLAADSGAQLRLQTTVTGWAGPLAAELTGPTGREVLEADAVVLATGCRERPRAARLVPGDRPAGVWTTGSLQQAVFLHGLPVGRRLLVVGAEHVSFSAVLTLAHAGARAIGLVTEEPTDATVPPLRFATATLRRVPVLTRTRVAAIHGRPAVRAVDLLDLRTGRQWAQPCDGVVFTGDWVAEDELARRADLLPAGGWLSVDATGRTGRPGVLAAGNLVHPALGADRCALDGRRVVPAVTGWLADGRWPAAVPVQTEPPLRWSAPGALNPAEPPPSIRVLAGAAVARATLSVRQGGRLLHRRQPGRLVAHRAVRVPAGWVSAVDPQGPPVQITLD